MGFLSASAVAKGEELKKRITRRCQDCDRAAGFFHGRDGGFGSPPYGHRHLGLELAHSEQAYPGLGPPQDPGLDQRGAIHRRIRIELAGIDRRLDAAEIDLVQLQRERGVAEAALGQTPMQGHLAALEALYAHARARRLALAAAAAGLAGTR